MDVRRFDALSRALAERKSRREAVRRLGAGGLAGGVAVATGVRVAAQDASNGACVLQFHAETAVGPSTDTIYDGTLTLEVDLEGNIDDGSLETAGGSFDVVGQATGRGLSLRIELQNDQVLTLIGTGEQDILLCRGEIQGEFGGPEMKDLGTWTASRQGAGQ
jgi:hypothetical protein